jgi:putative drug exporter of the RND superfamily
VLLPATMKLLGKWNWYLPSWLEWLPKGPALDAEGLPPTGDERRPAAEPRRRRPPEPQPAEA